MGTEDYLHLQYLSYPDVYLRWSRIRRFADLSLGVCGRLRLLETIYLNREKHNN